MTQMFGQTCCIWNHAKNKFDLKVYNPPIILFANGADVGESPNVFTKGFLTLISSHLIFPLISGSRSFLGCSCKTSTLAVTIKKSNIKGTFDIKEE